MMLAEKYAELFITWRNGQANLVVPTPFRLHVYGLDLDNPITGQFKK